MSFANSDTTTFSLIHVNLGSDADVISEVRRLDASSEVLWSQPNFIHEGPDPREYTPNDPRLGNQYHHGLIDNFGAWDVTFGNSDMAAGGPVVAAGGNIARGIDYLNRGEVRRGIEAISPKLVRDALKTWRIADEGMLDYNGNVISGKQNFGTGDYISQALGITPAQMARTYEARTAQKGRETKLRDRRKKLMMQWRRKDPKERVEFFRSAIMSFNRKNPEFRIMPGQLLKSISEQRRRETQTRAGAFTEKAAIRRIGEAYGG